MGKQLHQLTEEELEAHCGIDRYNDFVLTDAVRPSYELNVVPTAGYRVAIFKEKDHEIPCLLAAVSCPRLLDAFLELLDLVGQEVCVAIDVSDRRSHEDVDVYATTHVDLITLKSQICEHEDLLLNCGSVGIAAFNPVTEVEVQLDEHKLLSVYSHDLTAAENILQSYGLRRDDELKLIIDSEHVHMTHARYDSQLQSLKTCLGIDDDDYQTHDRP